MSGHLLRDAFCTGPFVSLKEKLREIQDYWHYRPSPRFRPKEVARGAFLSTALADSLRTRGICILENVLAPERLQAVRCAFDSLFACDQNGPVARMDDPGGFNLLVDFTTHPIFADLVLDELILAAVEAYYARPIYLVATQANRLEPVEPYEGSSYQWHHDMKGKYVKAMWLLTDVSVTGQRMSYVAGSHRVRHRSVCYEDSRFSESHARALGDVVECAVPGGSVVLFDTNGIHRGNRNSGPRRDVVFGVYSAGRYLHGCRFDADSLAHLSAWQWKILQRSRKAARGMEQ